MKRVEPALKAQGVTRRYGHRVVLQDVSVEVSGGEFLMLVGHNGAGKTTLIRVLAGLLKPSAGTVQRSGATGMVAHSSMLYDALTARENLAFFGRLHGHNDPALIQRVLEQMGLAPHGDRRVATFSRGMVQRLSIGRALLPDPELLLLDEPLTGLDDTAAATIREVLHDLQQRGRAIVVATHQLAELVDLASTVGFLVGGRLAGLEPVAGRDGHSVMAHYRELAANV
ncbi:MAG: ABC transporter ATP-binding protein [Gemmatimonadota bacterium]|nr:MAG: ABC transporter ATP-binding protein [Gemmatimonadota bacterium]